MGIIPTIITDFFFIRVKNFLMFTQCQSIPMSRYSLYKEFLELGGKLVNYCSSAEFAYYINL